MGYYQYKNADDTIRFVVTRQRSDSGSDWWNYDIFWQDGRYENFAQEAGETCRTRREAKEDIERRFGPIRSMRVDNISDGWVSYPFEEGDKVIFRDAPYTVRRCFHSHGNEWALHVVDESGSSDYIYIDREGHNPSLERA